MSREISENASCIAGDISVDFDGHVYRDYSETGCEHLDADYLDNYLPEEVPPDILYYIDDPEEIDFDKEVILIKNLRKSHTTAVARGRLWQYTYNRDDQMMSFIICDVQMEVY